MRVIDYFEYTSVSLTKNIIINDKTIAKKGSHAKVMMIPNGMFYLVDKNNPMVILTDIIRDDFTVIAQGVKFRKSLISIRRGNYLYSK